MGRLYWFLRSFRLKRKTLTLGGGEEGRREDGGIVDGVREFQQGLYALKT